MLIAAKGQYTSKYTLLRMLIAAKTPNPDLRGSRLGLP